MPETKPTPTSIIVGFMFIVLGNGAGLWIAARALRVADVVDFSVPWRTAMLLSLVYTILRAFDRVAFPR